MTNKNILKTLAGLAIVGAVTGGVVAYAKNHKNHLYEEDFDELMDEEEVEKETPVQERSYTTLPTDEVVEKEKEETEKTTKEPSKEEN